MNELILFGITYASSLFVMIILIVHFGLIKSKWCFPVFILLGLLIMPYIWVLSYGYGPIESLKVYLVLTAPLWVGVI